MMSSTENDVRRIMKVQLRFKAKSGEENVYEQEGLQSKPLEKIMIPFSLNAFNEPEEFQFVVWESQVSQETISDYDYFKYIVSNDVDDETKAKEYEMQKRNSILAALPEEYFELPENDFPKMNYCDITEQEMFGYDSIPANPDRYNLSYWESEEIFLNERLPIYESLYNKVKILRQFIIIWGQ